MIDDSPAVNCRLMPPSSDEIEQADPSNNNFYICHASRHRASSLSRRRLAKSTSSSFFCSPSTSSLPSSSSSCCHRKNCCLNKPSSSLNFRPRRLTICSLLHHLTFILILILSTFTQSSSSSDATYSVVRTSHICFLKPTLARPDRVTVERWFFNTTTRNCDPYQLELNSVDQETRNQLNDFASYRACHRLCYRIVRNMSDAELEARIRDGGSYYTDFEQQQERPPDPQQKPPPLANKQRTPTYVAAPTIVVSNVDAKARREHTSGSSSPRNNREQSQTQPQPQQPAAQADESVWSSSAYKQGKKTADDKSSSSAVSSLRHFITTQIFLVSTCLAIFRFL